MSLNKKLYTKVRSKLRIKRKQDITLISTNRKSKKSTDGKDLTEEVYYVGYVRLK